MSSINSGKGPSELPPLKGSESPDLSRGGAKTSEVKAVGSKTLAKLPTGGVSVRGAEQASKFTPVGRGRYDRFSPSPTEEDKYPSSATPQARTSPVTRSPLMEASVAGVFRRTSVQKLGQNFDADDKYPSSATPQARTSPVTRSPLMDSSSNLSIGKDEKGRALPSPSTDGETPLTSPEENK